MDLSLMETKMGERLEYLKEELINIRAGRANPKILDKITVEYYGSQAPLNQVASISVPEPRQIVISPWDRTLLAEISKAISKAEIGINPQNDGNGIRLTFPELNESRRKEIVKEINKIGEETKVAIRNVRRETIETLRKDQKETNIREDELHRIEEDIQKITDKKIENVIKLIEEKEKEIMEV